MYSFRNLQKARKKNIGGRETRLAILGNCATQLLSQAVEGYAKLSNLNLRVYDTDYGQLNEQLLDPSSDVYSFNAGIILLWLCTEKIYEDYLDMPLLSRSRLADDCIQKIKHYWELISQNSRARIIQMNFTEIDDKALGQYSCKVDSTFSFQIRKLNYLLQEAVSKKQNIYLADALAVQLDFGRENFFSAPLYYSSKMPVSMRAMPYLAKAVTEIILAMEGQVKKCVILDLDNTLWGGVIGDDGLGGIEIGELGRGHAFSNLQRWLKQLKEYGIILAVCSKNEEDIAREPFEKHEEMVLRLSDISLFVANWKDKASNIKEIQEGLNIGMNSIVFLDDNPFERNLVKERFPEIEAPELPEDPSLWLAFLQRKNYFETTAYTGTGSDRTRLYQAEFERKKLEQGFEILDDYLQSLLMEGEAKPFEPVKYARISQLTQRSNQFNLRTVRYTEDEIKHISQDDGYITLYYTLKDKLGDYGLVSAVILAKKSNEELFVDTWLMSCRALKRGMEEFAVNRMVYAAKSHGFKRISAEYIPTPKNRIVKDIYVQMGFTRTDETHYLLDVDSYREQKTYIKEKKVHESK